ncbi:TPA: N-6 DNA methylase [Vibrio alginolyticus]|uniref:N-6 DNA methylase n=1 Tax=Vibrio alginolyticus TaxID=663 RepID=UPI0022795A9D|nr:N-6 DNA methylase [Vibrio alginolyticus]WAE59652.1 SAM-dependent methyltransferase [Vibrio alginolyticus]
MAGIAIQNAFLKSDELEQEYLAIVRRYEKDDAVRMSHLLAEVVMGLEVYPCDFLGSVFMELELGSDRMGQFFTPFEVSKMMAMMVHGDTIDALSGKPFITLQEPACGAGGMVIAFAQTMYEKGLNPQKQLWASCVDVDPVAAMMAYVQLSLLHIPAEVVVGNSLSMKFTKVMRTPAHYLGLWDSKLRRYWSNDEAQNAVIVEDAPTAVPQPMVVIDKGQMSLFDMSA